MTKNLLWFAVFFLAYRAWTARGGTLGMPTIQTGGMPVARSVPGGVVSTGRYRVPTGPLVSRGMTAGRTAVVVQPTRPPGRGGQQI